MKIVVNGTSLTILCKKAFLSVAAESPRSCFSAPISTLRTKDDRSDGGFVKWVVEPMASKGKRGLRKGLNDGEMRKR